MSKSVGANTEGLADTGRPQSAIVSERYTKRGAAGS
jgi:hypothetical protein